MGCVSGLTNSPWDLAMRYSTSWDSWRCWHKLVQCCNVLENGWHACSVSAIMGCVLAFTDSPWVLVDLATRYWGTPGGAATSSSFCENSWNHDDNKVYSAYASFFLSGSKNLQFLSREYEILPNSTSVSSSLTVSIRILVLDLLVFTALLMLVSWAVKLCKGIEPG